MELDVYELIHRKVTSDRVSTQQNVYDCLEYSDDPEIGGTGADLNIQLRGCTPFEFGRQMGYFGIKVVKKTKYFIPNGQTITHQIRDPSRHSWSQEQMDKLDSFAVPGVTRTLFLVYKLVPGCPLGALNNTFQLMAEVGVTRKYMYKLEGSTEVRHRSIGGNYNVIAGS